MSATEDQRACVYGLRNQTRSVHALVGESNTSIFLVGTLGLNTENTIHAIVHPESSADEATADAFNSVSVVIYKHPHEVHNISSSYSPDSKNILSTSYNIVGEKSFRMRSTCWKINLDPLTSLQNTQPSSNFVHPEQLDLEPLFHFDDSFSKTGVRNILFDPSKNHTKTLAHDTQNLVIYAMTDSFSSAVPTVCTMPVETMTWHPQNSHLVALSNASGTYQYDLRTAASTLLVAAPLMTALDYHPTHPYTLAMGSKEGCLHVMDVRFPSSSSATHLLPFLRQQTLHTHRICQLHYNRFHDPLLLTSSTDHLVHVVKCALDSGGAAPPTPPSSAAPSASIASAAPASVATQKPYLVDLHEDSVYSCAWSAADAWVFCSASYDGRVLIHTLPTEWKYQIIMED